MSIESRDTSLEYHDFQEPSSEMVEEADHSMEEVTLVPDHASDGKIGGGKGGEKWLSAQESEPAEQSRPPEQSREESEPPEQSREESEPPEQSREDSEPPEQSREESDPLAESGERPTRTREEYKLPLQSRAESEPPVWCGKHLVWSKSRNKDILMEKALSTPDLRQQCTKEREFISGSKRRDATSSLEVRVVIPEEVLRVCGNEHTGQRKITVERTLSNEEHREEGKTEDMQDTSDIVSSEETSTSLKKLNFSDAHEVPSSVTVAVEEGREGDSGQREREKASLPIPVLQTTSPQPSQRVAEASHFICVSNEEVGCK